MSFRLFGLTGGLASGKSAVAEEFRRLGVPVIDADRVAREVVVPGSEGLSAVVEAFGESILAEDGTLDRQKLGERVFSDEAARKTLNGILHPRIGARTAELAAQLMAAGESIACYEAALLVENGLADTFRPLVVVAVPVAVQVERAMSRDGLSEEAVRARIAAQMPLEAKVAVADYVIDNAGDRASLERQAAAIVAKIRDLNKS